MEKIKIPTQKEVQTTFNFDDPEEKERTQEEPALDEGGEEIEVLPADDPSEEYKKSAAIVKARYLNQNKNPRKNNSETNFIH